MSKNTHIKHGKKTLRTLFADADATCSALVGDGNMVAQSLVMLLGLCTMLLGAAYAA
jgi:hypothetical protein